MLVECVSIILIILLVVYIFLRSHRKDYALTTLPLLILPLMHVLSLVVADPLTGLFPLDKSGVTVAMDATALVISCTALGFFSNRIAAKKARNAYLIVCGSFVAILTWVLISNTLLHH